MARHFSAAFKMMVLVRSERNPRFTDGIEIPEMARTYGLPFGRTHALFTWSVHAPFANTSRSDCAFGFTLT
jgi:hypothetical protein